MASIDNQVAKPIGYIDIIRNNRSFRYLWSAQIVSLLGDWFNLIASALLISTLTQSGAAIGGLFAVRMLSPFLMSPFAGVIADRYSRKHIVMTTDILRGCIVMCFVFVQEPEHVWLVYVLTAIQSALQGIYFPAWNSILPDITEPNEVGAANALSSATWSVMFAFGTAMGGIFAGSFGVYPSFVIDGLTFFVSVFIISRMPYQSTVSDSSDKSVKAGLRQYVDGLKYLRNHLDTFAITLHKATIGLLLLGVFQVAQVTIAEKYFMIGDDGSYSLGIMYLVAGIGTGVGPIIARAWAKDRDRQTRIAISIAYVCGILGLMITSTLASYPIVLLGAFLRGIGGGAIWVLATQLLLQIVPNQVRGRVFSTEFAMNTLFTAISSYAAGIMIDGSFGVQGSLMLSAVLMIIPTILWSLWIVYGKRDKIKRDEQAILMQ